MNCIRLRIQYASVSIARTSTTRRIQSMAPPTRTPPSKWIEEGLRALAAGGPDAVRIEALARTLGVTKGGFYNQFDDRPALLDEMLETWERLGVDRVIERVEADGGDARAKLTRLFAV